MDARSRVASGLQTAASWTLLLVAYAALADLAAETYASGSTLKWVVVGAAGAFVIVSAVPWRVVGNAAKAQWAFLLFAALVAYAQWTLGSLDAAQLHAFGLPVSGLAAALIAVVLALAAASMMLAARVPLALRIIVAVVVLYALVPLVAGVKSGGLDGALATNAWSIPGPSWLRGAILAIDALLPLCVIGAVIAAAVSLLRRARPTAALAVRLALAAALAWQVGSFELATRGLPSLAAFERAPATPAEATAAATVATTSTNRSLVQPETAGGSPAPATTLSIVRRIGNDPARLLSYVSSSIAYEPYAGVRSGALGTLASGAGNAADQALLLQALIASATPDARLRFATCTLDDDNTRKLLARTSDAPPARRKLVFEQADRLVTLTQDARAKVLLGRASALWHDVTGIARTETSRLTQAFATANVVPAAASDWNDRSRKVAAQHVWLQLQSGSNWVDLDPTLPAPTPNAVRCRADAVLDALPDERYDRVTLAIRIEERGPDGAPATHSILEKTARVADLIATNVTFMFAEPFGVRPSPSPQPSPASGMRAYTPVLRIGNTFESGTPLLLPPPSSSTTDVTAGNATKTGIESAIGALGGAATPSPSAAASPATTPLTAVWLTVSLRAAGGEAESFDVPIVDRIGFAARASGQAASAALAPIPEVEGEYAPFTTIWNVAIWPHLVPAGALVSGAIVNAADANALSDNLARLHASYGALRQALYEAAGPAQPAHIADVRPGISVLSFGLERDASGATRIRTAIDLVSDHGRVIAGSANDPNAAIRRGVVALLAERLLIRGGYVLGRRNNDPQTGIAVAHDVFGVFDAAQRANVPSDVLRLGGRPDVGAIGGSAEARAHLAAAVAAGDTVLVPAHEVANAGGPSLGWWRVDPHDGTVRDETDAGLHTDFEEEAVDESRLAKVSKYFRAHGDKLRCIVSAVAIVLNVGAGDMAGVADVASAQAIDVPALIAAIKKGEESATDAVDLACEAP